MTSRKRFEVWLASRTTFTDDLAVWQAAERDMLERAIAEVSQIARPQDEIHLRDALNALKELGWRPVD